jgi:hypothetical protein
LVESPTLVAFYASRYRGVAYSDPALIVLRSRDGRPLATSGSTGVSAMAAWS